MAIKKEPYRETVIYIRTSTEEQNPENQLQDCESIRPKDQRLDTFVDYSLYEEKLSAWNDKERPAFEQIKKLIKAKKIKHLIVWDLDRIYRSRKRLVEFFEYCKIYKCKVHAYRQKWLEDINNIPEPFNEIMHRLMLDIMGWLAEEESNKKSDRIKKAVRKKDNITISYKGNKWGRKPISKYKVNQIIAFHIDGASIRDIAEGVGLSKSVVHKTIKKFQEGTGTRAGKI